MDKFHTEVVIKEYFLSTLQKSSQSKYKTKTLRSQFEYSRVLWVHMLIRLNIYTVRSVSLTLFIYILITNNLFRLGYFYRLYFFRVHDQFCVAV